jgi:hypothetical protein
MPGADSEFYWMIEEAGKGLLGRSYESGKIFGCNRMIVSYARQDTTVINLSSSCNLQVVRCLFEVAQLIQINECATGMTRKAKV